MYFKMLKRVKKKILKAACIMKSDNLKKIMKFIYMY